VRTADVLRISEVIIFYWKNVCVKVTSCSQKPFHWLLKFKQNTYKLLYFNFVILCYHMLLSKIY